MKSKNKNIDNNIKKKIEEYEFDFSDHAWDKMESLMDPTASADDATPPSRSYLNLFRNLILMLILLIVLYFGWYSTSDQNLSTTHLSLPTSELQPTTETSKTTIPNPTTTTLPTATTEEQVNNKSITKQQITTATTIGATSTKVILDQPNQNPMDTSFLARLNKQLAQYKNHFSPEKVYLQFDRTSFKPGEAIWFSAYVRDANTLKASPKSDMVYVELNAPNGSNLKTMTLVAQNGRVRGDFQLDENAVGGLYTIKAYTNWQKNQDQFFEREIQVQAPVLPKLRMELDMEREAYGPGDAVAAKLELKNLENKALSNYNFGYTVLLKGEVHKKYNGKTDENGIAQLKFDLPKTLDTNEGLVNVTIDYKNQKESISRSIPIILNKIDLRFLPEGGDMVANLFGKVAFKAVNEFGKPADVEGQILNEQGQEVATFKSYHQGMGAFEFQPNQGEKYTARITKPTGIKGEFDLPEALDRGYNMKVGKVVNEMLEIDVQSTEAENLTVILRCNDVIYESRSTIARKGVHQVKIPVKNLPIGIAEVTLFDSKEIPRAERLVFLNPDKQLNISITTDKDEYKPREKVTMTVQVKDERGMPMPGQFSLAVVDDNLLTFADDKQGHILSYLLLESELKGKIIEPNFYFDAPDKHPKKDQLLALDYLMMTQGWRRFNWMDMEQAPNVVMQYPGEKAVIGGTVFDLKRQPVPNAALKIIGTNYETFSDNNGHFVFQGIPVNQQNYHNIQVTKNNISYNFVARQYGENFNFSLPLVYNSSPIFVERKKTPGQNGILNGVILDDNGEGLIGATVLLKGTQTGTSTDFNGKFQLKNLPPGQNDIVINYIGFATTEESILVNNDETIDATIALMSGNVNLDEIVVTDYKVPMVEQDNTTQGVIVTGNDIRKFANKNIASVAASTKGLEQVAEVKEERMAMNDDIVEDNKNILNLNTEKDRLDGIALMEDDKLAAAPNRSFNDSIERVELKKKANSDLQSYASNFKTGYYQAREFYMPVYEKEEKVEIRDDFRPTIYWNSTIDLDRKGNAVVEFFTNDDITTFRATIEGLTTDGGIGRKTHTFFSQLPFGMDVKIPERILSGDLIKLPLTLTNNTNETVKGELTLVIPDALAWDKEPNTTQKLGPKETKTIYLQLKARHATEAKGDFYIQFLADGFQDAFTKSLKIIPRGFPVEEVFSGREKEKEFILNVNHPIEGSVSAEFNCYPSTAKDLAAGLERMLRQPNGCFEQTSSSNYPNILVYDLLKSTNNLDKKTEKQILDYLEFGYKRLTGFEVQGGGFDWYGNPPAHEALTAYGLLQFVDMAKVYQVDQQMLDRTTAWLMTRKDGKGGWQNSKAALHSWASTSAISDAFIVWALTEAGIEKGIDNEIDKSYSDAMETKDPYLLALMANTLFKLNDKRAKEMMALLLPLQQEDGSWNGRTTSMTQSYGKGLLVETTALTALAILKDKVGMSQLKSAIDFLSSSKSQYGFGSTQSTVLAMKALVNYAKFAQSETTAGELALFINGKKVAHQKYDNGTQNNISFTNLESYLKTGENKVQVKFSNAENGLPYDLTLKYNTRQPNSSDACKVDLKTELVADKIKIGETIRLNTTITNLNVEAIPNTIAKVGIPAGLSLQAWQLKELQEKNAFDYYEIFDGYVVFHYRGLKAGERKEIGLDLKADIPGLYEAPASVAYLYYTNEEMRWAKPGVVTVE